MEGYGDATTGLKGICTAVADLNAKFEYRNRAAPVSFRGIVPSFVLLIPYSASEFLWPYSTLLEDNDDAVFNVGGYSDD